MDYIYPTYPRGPPTTPHQMYLRVGLSVVGLIATVRGQLAGTVTAEIHPKLTIQKCTLGGGCVTSAAPITLDANWRWLHNAASYDNCYTANVWNPVYCPDPVTCSRNCALEGADYSGAYGITTSGNAISMKFVTTGASQSNVGSRVYLMSSDTQYQLFSLKNQELVFDVDVSNLPCGINGALYFTQMDADGGMSKYASNKAGAKYGTGYCAADCPRDVKFINGEANVLNWTPDNYDPNYGTGQYGSCCQEMDIWESNMQATTYVAHPCSVTAQTRCSGTTCDPYAGYCDRDGCDFNPYRDGNKTFYGPGMTIDTTRKITVLTQWITSDGTANGQLTEIRRSYVQNGKVIANAITSVPGVDPANSITEKYCTQQKAAFGDPDRFNQLGGLPGFGNGKFVLTMSIWEDHQGHNLWLDGVYPPGANATKPGVTRGTCSATTGSPPIVFPIEGPTPSVIFSNIKFGDIGSTLGPVV